MKNVMLTGILILVFNAAAYANPTQAVDGNYDTNIANPAASAVEFTVKINGVLRRAKVVLAKSVTGDPTYAVAHYMTPIQQVKRISGPVESINTRNNTIVLKDLNQGNRFIVALQEQDIASLNKGDIVHATIRCNGSNMALALQK